MEYKHLLITRLNVFYKTKIAERGFDPEIWLLERIEIFKKFCYPSILNQSIKEFHWFFYIDGHTPVNVIEDLERIFKPFSFIKLISHEYQSFNISKYLQADIQKFLGNDFQYLISSRVDTDDMLHNDYIGFVQRQFKNQTYLALNFNKGLVYDVQSAVTSIMIHRYNAFLSLIEKRTESGFKTVYYKQHTEYRNDKSKLEINVKEPMWCVTIHGLNDSTGFYGRVNISNQPNMQILFGFKFQQKPRFKDVCSFTIRSFRRTFQKVLNKFINLKKINFKKFRN
ncbi:putative rhamnosyl transferase [Aquiflexum sp. LQ15W]|uniref:glycosyltransferase n=1 Tax=Cognataquiflexum nitidum TaxID=2922272 RepID=UPI001F145693|nr:glycosyltransferase [Cognataquiflexum nitidum]MCH6202124.1 putative rhamnosyl transferase [Cognataquiflexum nitidum]